MRFPLPTASCPCPRRSRPEGPLLLTREETRASAIGPGQAFSSSNGKTPISSGARSTPPPTTAAPRKGRAPSPNRAGLCGAIFSLVPGRPHAGAGSSFQAPHPRTVNRVQPSSESRCCEPEPLLQSQAHYFLRLWASQARFAMNPKAGRVTMSREEKAITFVSTSTEREVGEGWAGSMPELTPRPGPRHGPLEMREPKLAPGHPRHRRDGGKNRK